METWFEIKVRGILGPEVKDGKEITILGRKVVWTEDGITYEADPKHSELVMEFFGFVIGARSLGIMVCGRGMSWRRIGRNWRGRRRRSLEGWRRG